MKELHQRARGNESSYDGLGKLPHTIQPFSVEKVLLQAQNLQIFPHFGCAKELLVGNHFWEWNSGVLNETHIEGNYYIRGELEPTRPDFEPYQSFEDLDLMNILQKL